MKYQLVYKEHNDKFGNWMVRNDRGEYAAAPTGVAGAKPRRWLLSEDAARYMQQRAAVDVSFVWLTVPTVCQGKPGATAIRHADAYKPSHGGYPDTRKKEKSEMFMFTYGTNTGRMVSSSPQFAEVPRATDADLKSYDEIARAARRRADRRNEIPPVGTVHTGGNEEASTIPDAVLFLAIVDAGSPTSLLTSLLAARSMFPKL